ncbi:MAG: hypothetical protein ACRDNF_14745 [Streptosporangiaceae bacterium]
MDLVERAGQLKPMLVKFATSSRFDDELSAVLARRYPAGAPRDEVEFSQVLDHFALQHELPSGATVVEEFVAAHPELTGDERDMLLGWRDVVEGIFEITRKERGALVLLSYLDELTYRARSNLGSRAFGPLRKGMILVGRLVPAGNDWMVSGHLSSFPASARDQMLEIAAKQAMRFPKAVFRNPAKLAQARSTLARHHELFVDLFGDDLIVVPGTEVANTVQAFSRHVAQRLSPGTDDHEPPRMNVPDELLDASGVAVYLSASEGLSFYPGYDLLDELFRDPALISRRLYREVVSGFLDDSETSPEPLRRLAARDPVNASKVFARLLKRKGFNWDTDGEQLLRQHKPSYFDGTALPNTVTLSPLLAEAFRRTR